MSKSLRIRISLVTPIICTIVYLALGFTLNLWHPTWAIFFLILIVPELLSDNALELIYPHACTIAYVVVGLSTGIWHPTWLIFLTIPVYFILFDPLFRKRKAKKQSFNKVDSDKKWKVFEFTCK